MKKIIFSLLLSLLLSFSFNIVKAQVISEADSLELVRFYQSTDGDNWKNNNGWLVAPIEGWYGLLFGAGGLRNIDLENNNITGSIMDLSFESPITGGINLGNNNLTGFSIKDSEWVGHIYLYNNKLTEVGFDNLPRLDRLDVEDNQLTTLTLENLPNLQNLFVQNNQLTTLTLENLPKLGRLYISNNQFTQLTIENLPELSQLDVSDNQLTQLTLENLPNLQDLFVQNNQFTTLTLEELPKLERLFASSNQLTQLTLENFPKLSRLSVSDNQFTELTLKDLSKLESIDVSSNQLTTLTLENLPELTFSLLSNNQFTELTLENLPTLSYLDISNNQLTQLTLTNLPQLWGLDAQNNQLTAIPDIANHPGLHEIYLQNNKLHGPLPSFDGFANFSTLDISYNNFNFEGLEEIIMLKEAQPNFNTFIYQPQACLPIQESGDIISIAAGGNVANNTYTWYKNGEFYNELLGDSTLSITELGNYDCRVKNSIVTQLTLCSDTLTWATAITPSDSLELVRLYEATNGDQWDNNSGWLVDKVVNWHGVTLSEDQRSVLKIELNQSSAGILGNNLTGELINLNLPFLEKIDLSHNELTGNLPAFDGLPKLQILRLSNNQLSGIVPNIAHLSQLQTFDIRFNQFTFDGLEQNVNHFNSSDTFNTFTYAPQACIAIQENASPNENSSILSVAAGGNASNNSYTWFKDNQQVATIINDSTYVATEAGTYSCRVTNLIANLLSLCTNEVIIDDNIVVCSPDLDCVWTGDTDQDGIATNDDLYNIGRAYNEIGYPRFDQSISWNAKYCLPWDSTFVDAVNFKHADCNGNGIIDERDIDAIYVNYGKTHNKTGQTFQADGTPLFVELNETIIDSVEHIFSVHFGDMESPAEDVYFIAFTLRFQVADAEVVVNNPVLLFEDSWLEQENGNILTLDTCFNQTESEWIWEVGITRTNKLNTSGFGTICKVACIMDVMSIDGKTKTESIPLTVNIEDINVLSYEEMAIAVQEPVEQKMDILIETTVEPVGIADYEQSNAALTLVPNPIRPDQPLTLHFPNNSGQSLTIHLYDIAGKKLATQSSNATHKHQLYLPTLPVGTYLVQIEEPQHQLIKSQKLVVIE